MNELARRQIMSATQGALRAAGVLGIVPTPLEAISQIAGLGGVVDISDLPPDLEAKKPAAWKRILGALLVRERTVFVDAAQTWPRRRFVEAHEYGHWLIPWQQASYHLDDERRLSPETKERYEVEANLAAAHLIFQGTESSSVHSTPRWGSRHRWHCRWSSPPRATPRSATTSSFTRTPWR